MTEQLGLDERLGDGAGVDRHEGAGAPRARGMDRARDQLLAGAALAGDQHAVARRRDALDQREQLAHRRGGAQQLLEATAGLRLALPRRTRSLEMMQVTRALHDHAELLDVDRLAVIVERAQADGVERHGLLAVARDHDDLAARVAPHDLGEHAHALAGAARIGRQPEIERDDRGPELLEPPDRRGTVAGQRDLEVAGERPAQLRGNRRLVLDDEEPRARHGVSAVHRAQSFRSGTGKRARTVVPCPSRLTTSMSAPWAVRIDFT